MSDTLSGSEISEKADEIMGRIADSIINGDFEAALMEEKHAGAVCVGVCAVLAGAACLGAWILLNGRK